VLPIIDFEISDALKKQGVSRVAKQGTTMLIKYNDSPIRFDIDSKKWSKTIENFENESKRLFLDQETKQSIIFYLSDKWFDLINFNSRSNAATESEGEYDKNKNLGVEEDEELVDLAELETKISDKDYAEFVIRTAKKTVKQEDSLLRQVFYVGLSVDSDNPLGLGIMAPTGEGKTYVVKEVILKFFPKKDVWVIGSMSPKVLIRQNGILVDSNNEPIKNRVIELKELICVAEEESKKEELKEQIRQLYENSKVLIDLSGKILVFLEPPHHELWSILKPILSHDAWEIEHPFVDKTEYAGTQVKKVVTRGWPVCIFCSARDESRWEVWPEIQSRFLITSPNMAPEKYQESNFLTAQKMSLPYEIQQQVIVSDKEIELAKQCVLYLKQEIKKLSSSNSDTKKKNPVWIPYGTLLGEILRADKGSDMRIEQRIFSLLSIIPLAKMHLRYKLIYGSEKLVIASLEDLGEVLHITQNISGLPSYKIKFFREIFLPLFRSKTMPNEKDGKEEKLIAVTTKQISDYYKEKTAKAISSDNIKKKFLNELISNDYIGEVESELDKRQYIYYPLIELDDFEDQKHQDYKEKITKLSNKNLFDNFLQYSKIILPKYCRNIPENWLIYEILSLAKHRIDLDHFEGCLADFLNQHENLQFLNKDDNRLTIREFISEYEKAQTLIRYFRTHEYSIFFNDQFHNLEYIGKVSSNISKKLSSLDKFDKKDIFALQISSRNILYSQDIVIKSTSHSTTVQQPSIARRNDNNEIEEENNRQQQIENDNKGNNYNELTSGAKSDLISEWVNGLEKKGILIDKRDLSKYPELVYIFWQKFEELENESSCSNKIVKGEKLKANLVSSNKFFVGDAAQIIRDMIKAEEIEEVQYDLYKRRKKIIVEEDHKN
jgi:predicted transcriptional regulator